MNKEETFNKILVENEARIKRICRYYQPNSQDQQDIYQEVLVNIWKSLDGFRGDSALSTWIYRIAINTALTYTGKAYKYMQLVINTETQNLGAILDESEIEEKKLKEEQLERMRNELNLLSVIDKAMITLMLEGLSMREIADVIGITESNVKVKIHRIKTELKNKLNRNSNESK